MNRKLFGNYGEDVASRYLSRNGYKILQKNFRTKFGEIDIIAKEENTIVFIEVKTRENDKFVSPFAAINKNKQEHIIKASLCYLKNKRLFEKVKCRFDVVSVLSNDYNKIELVKDAFRS